MVQVNSVGKLGVKIEKTDCVGNVSPNKQVTSSHTSKEIEDLRKVVRAV